MRIISTVKQMAAFSKQARLKSKAIGFVPTMGALHQGHISLIRRARKENDVVVVSIFVNPVQFGPREDFEKYPRNLKFDAGLCRNEHVDVIFHPGINDMYPAGYKTYVNVEALSDVLCGRLRPGHFKGVATVVTKLFNIISPDIAYFGQKDAQQSIVIKKLVSDLNIPVKIKVVPTVRERDGLAMSSRNIYLSQNEREDAAVLCQALKLAKDLINGGNTDSSDIIRRMSRLINERKSIGIQYISIVDPKELRPIYKIKDRALIAIAVRIGRTRLIDNIEAYV